MPKRKTTAQAMSRHLVTITAESRIGEAQILMEEKRIRHLPVIDAEGFVIGILSDRDVQKAMNPTRPGFSGDLRVMDFMSWPAITVDETLPVAEVAQGMINEKVSCFLVTCEGREVVGIVTTDDLLRLLVADSPGKSTLEALPYTPIVREAIQELQSLGI